ncbi:MAG: hypothetical protein K2Q14_07405 [Gammaproteobacteria bacterium]|nr:hypothetical protein [Gammaproteobacteria bacterium]
MNHTEIKYKKSFVALTDEMKQFSAYQSRLFLSYERREKHLRSVLGRCGLNYHRALLVTRKIKINENKKKELTSLGRKLEAHITTATQLSQVVEFKKKDYDNFFKEVNHHIGGWGRNVLDGEHCKDMRQQRRPITQFLKRIGNILLPFTVIGPLIKMGLHGKNHAYSNCRTRMEDLAGDLIVNVASRAKELINTSKTMIV